MRRYFDEMDENEDEDDEPQWVFYEDDEDEDVEDDDEDDDLDMNGVEDDKEKEEPVHTAVKRELPAYLKPMKTKVTFQTRLWKVMLGSQCNLLWLMQGKPIVGVTMLPGS